MDAGVNGESPTQTAPTKQQQVLRFMKLFRGLNRARGVWHPSNGKMETTREEPTEAHFLNHLEGKEGIGIIPIDDNALCHWAVIDVDAHESDWFIELQPLVDRIRDLKLPLVVCQSKSCGAHLYLFLREPQPAARIQDLLKTWVPMLKDQTLVRSREKGGQPVAPALVEIFPKQRKLSPDQIGNWVNLPYFNARETTRFATDGHPLGLSEFLDRAESMQATKEQVFGAKPDYPDAPPCVQRILSEGIDMGSRNNALFAVGVYLKRAGAEDLVAELLAINVDKDVIPRSMGTREVKGIGMSILKNDYRYRCNETPVCDLCDKSMCRTRKFGVGEAGPTKAYDAPAMGGLKKVLTDPPHWILEVNGIPIEYTTEQLLDYKQVRKGMLEHAAIVAPPMKNEDWAILLRVKNEQRAEISAPDDAGPGAMVKALLCEFTRGVERTGPDNEPVMGKMEDLLRGMPVLSKDKDTGETFVFFRGVDFIGMLKRKRAEEYKGAALWSILRAIGCCHDKIRVGSQTVQVWLKPFTPWNVVYEVPKPKEDF